jgi:hypothetical protein
MPPDGFISGLAWNPSESLLWEATNSENDTIYALNPETCAVLASISHPNPGFNGAGLELTIVATCGWSARRKPGLLVTADSDHPG